ncbi:hypothetical protein BCV70DRAFT_192949 [Testicularia cyperi]|uniref:Amidohydrolase 3 domain-containing protein n=1 Tax=Testicularia cyperi TaxID=1882483 RepID=A0A317XKQ3_9BASI|nr:hypothetical protein BCV70DRAFT_192949 [Testicularia cyperi]
MAQDRILQQGVGHYPTPKRFSRCFALVGVVALAILASLFLSADELEAQHHQRGFPSQFRSLPDRYVICSPPKRTLSVGSASSQGSIYTGDDDRFADSNGFAQCVAIDNGTIADVGSRQDVVSRFFEPRDYEGKATGKKKTRRPKGNKAARLERSQLRRERKEKSGAMSQDPRIVHLQPGQTLFPGFQDAHGHILDYGWSLKVVDLVGARSVDEVVRRLEAYVRRDPRLSAFANGESTANVPWLEGLGWDQTKWSPPIFPTAKDLSKSPVLRNFPISLRRVDVHALWLSEKALALVSEGAVGFPKSPAEDHRIDGGLVLRDDAGNPTGILIDHAMNLAYQVIPSWTDEQRQIFLDAAAEGLLRAGITAVGDAATDLQAAAFYKRLDDQGKLPFRIYSLLACPPEQRLCAHRIAKVRPTRSRDGHGRFTLRAVKLFNDGALGSWGSAMWEDYADKPGERGLLLIREEELKSVVSYWLERGWQVGTHAIGDRANTLTLDAYEAYLAAHPGDSDLRPRVEHAQLLRPADFGRFAELGVIASVQPTHCTSDMGYVESRLGYERAAAEAYPWKSLVGRNASVALGSDFPVELPDPLHGMYSSITRLDPHGDSPHGPGGWFPHERLTRRQALKGFTQDVSFAQFEESISGTIAVGKRADLTVLDRNILDEDRVSALSLRNARVDATIIDGRVVYDRLQSKSAPIGSLVARLTEWYSASVARVRGRVVRALQHYPLAMGWMAGVLSTVLLLALLLISQWSGSWRGDTDPDIYRNLSALALNVRRPLTVWMNMGLWRSQEDLADEDLDLSTACKALAEKLYARAAVKPESNILDVGCGSGDSTLLLNDTYRPKVLHAVTYLDAEARVAASRIESHLAYSGTGKADSGVKVWAGDVNRWFQGRTANDETYDYILALDCAYHFADRAQFIRLASARLNSGGTLAFVDALASWPAPTSKALLGPPRVPYPRKKPGWVASLRHRINCMSLSVSIRNLWSIDRYVEELCIQGGFKSDSVQIEDITADTFVGFARFLRQVSGPDSGWRGGGPVMRLALGQFADVVERWGAGGDEGMLRYCVIVAQKASP